MEPESSSPTPGSPSAKGKASSPAGEEAVFPLVAGDVEIDPDDARSIVTQSTLESDTASLRSSILAYRQEHGRRYHSYQSGQYWGPNDEKQQEAEDLFHGMYMDILDGDLWHVNLTNNVQSVLDVGCGTGSWAIDVADRYPSAEVTGVDLSPIQPVFVPPNCRFEVDDFLMPWTFPTSKFDLVHIRFLTGCIPDWTQFFKEAIIHVKPGGWAQNSELSPRVFCDDGTLPLNSPLSDWHHKFEKVSAKTGKTFNVGINAGKQMETAGFINVNTEIIKVPIGTWPSNPKLKKWGAWNRLFLLQGLEGFAMRGLIDWAGYSETETQVYLMGVRKNLTDPAIHSYLKLYIATGQKPE